MTEPNNKKFAKIVAFVMGAILVGVMAVFTSCSKGEPNGKCYCFDVKTHEEIYSGSVTKSYCDEQQKKLEKVNNYVCSFE